MFTTFRAFPDLRVPAPLIERGFTDTSCGNDFAAKADLALSETLTVRVWVDYPQESRRETGSRFAVQVLSIDSEEDVEVLFEYEAESVQGLADTIDGCTVRGLGLEA